MVYDKISQLRATPGKVAHKKCDFMVDVVQNHEHAEALEPELKDFRTLQYDGILCSPRAE